MMGELRRHFRDHGWSVKVPRRLKDLSPLLRSAREHLAQRPNRAPTASELAVHLGISREEVVDGLIAAAGYSAAALHDSFDSDDGGQPSAVVNTLGALDSNIDKVLDRQTVRPLLQALPERERELLYLRFFENSTQTQIAATGQRPQSPLMCREPA
jgi:RNA polymerase sigma-B factor